MMKPARTAGPSAIVRTFLGACILAGTMGGCTAPADEGEEPLPVRGGGPATADHPAYDYAVAVAPTAIAAAELREADGTVRQLQLADIPRTDLWAVVYVAQPDEFKQASLVLQDADGRAVDVLESGH